MRNARFHNLSVRWLLGCFAGVALAASGQPDTFGGDPSTSRFIRIPSDTDDWTRHFRIGAVVGLNIKANFNMKGAFNLPGNNAANGIYDDGYVHADQSGDTEYTGYWGYENSSQLSGSTLTMHGATSFTAEGSSSESGVFPGFELAYGGNLWYWKHARVGWELGMGLMPISITDKRSIGAQVTQSTYNFDVSGIVVPDAPYHGGASGEGEPIIPINYFSTGATNSTGTVSGSHSLDVMLYTARLGPTFYWDITEDVAVSVGAGPAIGIVSGDYKFDETITASGASSSISGKISGTKLVYGGYVNTMVIYHVPKENADIFVGAQFMPMKSATFSGGDREGRLNLSGQVHISAGVNWAF